MYPERPCSGARLFTTFLALLFSVAVPAAAAAQTVEIKAQPGVTVLAVTEDGRVPLGTVSPQGGAPRAGPTARSRHRL